MGEPPCLWLHYIEGGRGDHVQSGPRVDGLGRHRQVAASRAIPSPAIISGTQIGTGIGTGQSGRLVMESYFSPMIPAVFHENGPKRDHQTLGVTVSTDFTD